jgi:hypothetical protein
MIWNNVILNNKVFGFIKVDMQKPKAKLRMLQFYYDLIDEYTNRSDFEMRR